MSQNLTKFSKKKVENSPCGTMKEGYKYRMSLMYLIWEKLDIMTVRRRFSAPGEARKILSTADTNMHVKQSSAAFLKSHIHPREKRTPGPPKRPA